MPMSPRLLRPRASSALVATDADARAYINAVRIADGGQYMETGVQRAIDDFIIGCKADSIWTAIKASCILMGARTLAGALTPLVGPAPTNVGPFVAGDYNRETGLLGNGSTKYLDSNRNNNTDGQSDNHLAVYVSTLGATTGGRAYVGAGSTSVTGTTQLLNRATPGGVIRARGRNGTVTTGGTGTTDIAGLIAQTRSSSSSFSVRSNKTTTPHSVASETPFNGSVFVFATNNAGTAAAYSDARMAYYSIGEAIDMALLDDRLSTLYTAIGAAIP